MGGYNSGCNTTMCYLHSIERCSVTFDSNRAETTKTNSRSLISTAQHSSSLLCALMLRSEPFCPKLFGVRKASFGDYQGLFRCISGTLMSFNSICNTYRKKNQKIMKLRDVFEHGVSFGSSEDDFNS